MVDRILCLANSYKHDHRCMAGIRLGTKKWIRLVGPTIPGCLTVKEASYSNGTEVRLLDIFEADLGEPCASNCHPEDVYLNPSPLRLVDRLDQPYQATKLLLHKSREQSILQGASDRIYVRKIQGYRVPRSIELIQPEDLWWWIRDESGKRKNRALFRIGAASRIRYDLAVTDPVWLQQLSFLNPGIYRHSVLCGDKPDKTLLTVSLSEPFENFHYKIVAGVLCLPESTKTARPVAPAALTR